MYKSEKVKVGDRVRIVDVNNAPIQIGDTGVVESFGGEDFRVRMDKTNNWWYFEDKHVEFIEAQKFTRDELDRPLVIRGEHHHLLAVKQDLIDLGYEIVADDSLSGATVTGIIHTNYLQKDNEDTLLGLYVVESKTIRDNFHKNPMVFDLVKDWQKILDFGKAQLANVSFLGKEIKIAGNTFFIKQPDDNILIDHDSSSPILVKREELIAILDNRFAKLFGNPIESIKVGCTTYTRDDCKKLMRFLKAKN